MRVLFLLAHPAKFHFHKVQINKLKQKGHKVKILIVKKDILEDLVKEEGWPYLNIYPEGRKIKGFGTILNALISTVRMTYRLIHYTRNKNFDLYIGDFLTWLGRIRGVDCLFPTDDVLSEVPEGQIFYIPSTFLFAPKITDLGYYDKKTIRYDGYKALAHLHPNHFIPDKNKLSPSLRKNDFFLIRCTGFMATHDKGHTGITDNILRQLLIILNKRGKVIISSERELPDDLKNYTFSIRKSDISHYISFCKIFISDSTTMTAEAAVLGTPSLEYDSYFEKIDQMVELGDTFSLTYGFSPSRGPKRLYNKLEDLLNKNYDLKQEFQTRRKKLIETKIDVSSYLIWIIENYPQSIKIINDNPDYQYKFRQEAKF